ncbi:hypothetical protein [Moorena producens]|uniref:hypothetical protein n=1 Tax=Moorena producens TaxID=1155739 RepID=UPI003C77BDEA
MGRIITESSVYFDTYFKVFIRSDASLKSFVPPRIGGLGGRNHTQNQQRPLVSSSLLPAPCSLLPAPCSLLPAPCSL